MIKPDVCKILIVLRLTFAMQSRLEIATSKKSFKYKKVKLKGKVYNVVLT